MSTLNSNPTFNTGECPVCLDEKPLFTLPCTHSGYCQICHADALRNLQEGDPLPECPICSDAIPFRAFQSLLTPEQYATMNTRMLEWDTPADQRLYCSNTVCLKFIPASAPTSARGRECACRTVTCFACKGNAHDGACLEDEDLKAAIETAQGDGAVSCPKCGCLIQRISGCSHISGVHFGGCAHEFCVLCLRDWEDCLGSCEGSHEDAERILEEEMDEWEFAQIAAEEAAAARLGAEFRDWDLHSADQMLRFLQVMTIVHREYIIRLIDPAVALGIVSAGALVYHYGETRLPEDVYQSIAKRIMDVRDRVAPMFLGPDDPPYVRNREVLESFLSPVRQLRTANFIAAEEEATELLSLYHDQDLAENRRFYENVLLSLVRTDYE